MPHHRPQKTLQSILAIAGAILLFIALAVLFGWLDSPLSQFIAAITHRQPKPSWPGYLRQGGLFLFVLAIPLLLNKQLLDGFHYIIEWGTARLEVLDRWSEKKFAPETETTTTPLNRWDALIILFSHACICLSAFYRARISHCHHRGTANIASFVAGRAYQISK
jgi:hypothetical protein